MDETDGKLLAHLVRDPLARTGVLCETVGLTPNAVRARLENLQARGILWGARGVPNPLLFDRTSVVAVYDVPVEGNPPPGTLLEVEEVTAVSENYDGRLAAICWLPGPDADTPVQLDERMGGRPVRRFVERTEPLDPPGRALSTAKWRIMEEMLPDPRIQTSALAEAAGVSPKRARRLRDWLVNGGHLEVETIIQEDQGGEVMFHELYAQGPAAARPERVQDVLAASWVVSRVEQPVGVLLLCQASHLGEAIASRDRVSEVEGIDHAELVLGVEFHWDPRHLQEACRARATEALERR